MSDTLPSPSEHTSDSDATYLSFANPNYHFDESLHSNLNNNNNNSSSLNENLFSENDKINSVSDTKVSKNRKNYANIGLSDMGIISPVQLLSPDKTFILDKLNSPDSDENSDDETYGRRHHDMDETDKLLDSTEVSDLDEVKYSSAGPPKPMGFMNYYSLLEAKARERQNTQIESPDSPDDGLDVASGDITPLEQKSPEEKYEGNTMINSPDSNDSGIQSDARSDDGVTPTSTTGHDEEIEVTKLQKEVPEEEASAEDSLASESDESSEILPPGWEKCEDNDGAYYWHIKSGTIQRDPPSPLTPDQTTLRSISITSESSTVGTSSSIPSTPTSITSNTEDHLQEFEGHALQYAAKSLQSLCSLPDKHNSLHEEPNTEKPIRFAVRSLGWVSIDEEDLTPERSSKAVNKCIVDLSLGRNDINDAVGRWGDGKDLFMDLDSNSLRLVDTQDFSLLNSQPIHSIRVWGVGRDNGRDFAYVARDKMSRRHMCHVFRCDTPARQIANTLKDICKKIMVERTAMQRLSRPTDLPNLEKNNQPNGQKLSFQSLYSNASFPTPMEEPKKNLRCHYLGQMEVNRATGMETLNEAIDRAYRKVPPERWLFVNVAVAPSTITISEHGRPENKIDECRVRFLSFMGIAMSNVKLCAFIMHDAQDHFYAHVFHCEPSGGPLCKTIEAACKLRYQKCLDAHPQTPKTPSQSGKNIGTSIKSGMQTVFGSIAQLASPK